MFERIKFKFEQIKTKFERIKIKFEQIKVLQKISEIPKLKFGKYHFK